MKKWALYVGLVAVLSCLLVSTGWANMRSTRMRQGFDQKITELMILAHQARSAGDMANAELFWMHARELRPSLPRPAWLDQKPEPVVEKPAASEDEVLARIASLPYPQAKILLEERLSHDPANARVRELYLELAKKSGDHTEVARHSSLLSQNGKKDWKSWLWHFAALVVLILVVWQVRALYRDFTG